MKISSGIIIDKLQKDFDIEILGEINYGLLCYGIAYARTDRPFLDGMVWLADKDAKHVAEVFRAEYAKFANSEPVVPRGNVQTAVAPPTALRRSSTPTAIIRPSSPRSSSAQTDTTQSTASRRSAQATAVHSADKTDAQAAASPSVSKANTLTPTSSISPCSPTMETISSAPARFAAESPPAGMAITRDAEAAEVFAEAFGVAVLIKGKTSFTLIHDVVQSVLAKYNAWDEDMRRVLADSSDVWALIDAATSVFENPLLLHDSNFTVIAVSSAYRDDPSLMPLLDDKKLPFLMKSDRPSGVSGTVTDKVISFSTADMPCFGASLFRRGKFKYRLMLTGLTKEPDPSDAALIEHLADYTRLALGLVREEGKSDLTVASLVSNIIAGEITSREYIARELAGFGWNESDEYIFYRILPETRERDGGVLRFMTGRIADLFGGKCVFDYDGGIVAAYDMTGFPLNESSLDSAISGFMRDNNLIAGRSDKFTGIGELPLYYKQASLAYDFGQKIDPYRHLYKFRDIVKPYLLSSCGAELPPGMLCAPELVKLKAYDAEHKTDFYQTLSAFLKNDLHSVKAAKELFIARSTFIYRIERIQSITGLDFSKLDDRWYLLLSLELIGKEME